MSMDRTNYGISLKREHLQAYLHQPASCGWLEVIAENLLTYSEGELLALENLRQDYQLSLHITCSDIGGQDQLADCHLASLSNLIKRFEPSLVSDHLSFCRADQVYFHDLLPIPYTKNSLTHTISRVHKVQEVFQHPILLENISQYTRYHSDSMPEHEFLKALAQSTDCGILLDLNNLYVNQQNLQMDAITYLQAIPREAIREIHVAGHQRRGPILIDTHDGPPSKQVIDFLCRLQNDSSQTPIPVILEWDQNVPPLEQLHAALDQVILEQQSKKISDGWIYE